jgi:hypothetical protein
MDIDNTSIGQTFYLLKCLNESFSVIISEIDEKCKFNEILNSNNGLNLTEAFYQIYSVSVIYNFD